MRSEKISIVSVETVGQCVIFKAIVSVFFRDKTCNKIPVVHCIHEEYELYAS